LILLILFINPHLAPQTLLLDNFKVSLLRWFFWKFGRKCLCFCIFYPNLPAILNPYNSKVLTLLIRLINKLIKSGWSRSFQIAMFNLWKKSPIEKFHETWRLYLISIVCHQREWQVIWPTFGSGLCHQHHIHLLQRLKPPNQTRGILLLTWKMVCDVFTY
jgi:hypothetical protein